MGGFTLSVMKMKVGGFVMCLLSILSLYSYYKLMSLGYSLLLDLNINGLLIIYSSIAIPLVSLAFALYGLFLIIYDAEIQLETHFYDEEN